MKKVSFTIILVLVIALSVAGVVSAGKPLTTLKFDELPFQSVDGLSFRGVNFGFSIDGEPSSDAYYGSGGPGYITFIQDPSLEGNSYGTLSLVFDKPTIIVEFGVAQSCSSTIYNAVTVSLHRPGKGILRDTVDLTLSPLVSFSEGHFNYRGPAVKTLVIDFTDECSRFAFDNLVYHEGEED